MSWTEGYFDFPASMKKEDMMLEVNQDLYENRGAYEPTPQKYIFLQEEPLPDYEAAKEYLNSKELAHYYRMKNVAVRYYNTEKLKPTKKMEDLKRRIDETYEKLVSYKLDHSVVNFKAEYVGCPSCGSKVAKKYLKTDNRCPVCNSDMSSDTTKKTIKGYQDKIKALEKQLKELERKNTKKGEVYWLISAQLYIG